MGREHMRCCGRGMALPALCVPALLIGCASSPDVGPPPPVRPDVRPASVPSETTALRLDVTDVKPMYTEMLAIDLPTVVKVAVADNFDIRQARLDAVRARGRLESAVGAAFPALVPTALFEHVEGTVRATEGDLVGVGFNTFQASIAIQWVINPGKVIHNIVAAKKRLAASEQHAHAVVLETLRKSVVRFYGLVLAQARVSAARQGADEAQELLRINRLRTRTGTGIAADELRAEARLAERRQDLITAMMEFYNESVQLARSLQLDATVTLVPRIESLPPVPLVRDDVPIEELLDCALTFRPDLERVRLLVEAVQSDRDATWWGAFGPQFQVGYQFGGITAHTNNIIPVTAPVTPTGSVLLGRDDQTYGFSEQQRGHANLGWHLSVSAFGDLRAAGAVTNQAMIEAERRLDTVRAEVVVTAQASRANWELIALADQQVASAAEALRLTEANLRAGSMTTLDVLQAQDAATQARLRHAEAVVRYNQSQVDLLAAIGLIDEDVFIKTDQDDGASPHPDPDASNTG